MSNYSWRLILNKVVRLSYICIYSLSFDSASYYRPYLQRRHIVKNLLNEYFHFSEKDAGSYLAGIKKAQIWHSTFLHRLQHFVNFTHKEYYKTDNWNLDLDLIAF